MSIQLIAKAYDLNIPSTKKFVFIILCDHADHTGHNCYPSQERIARHTNLSVDTVSRAIKWLIMNKYVQVLENSGGRTKSTKYWININKLEGIPSSVRGFNANTPQSAANTPQRPEKTPAESRVIHQLSVNNQDVKKKRENRLSKSTKYLEFMKAARQAAKP